MSAPDPAPPHEPQGFLARWHHDSRGYNADLEPLRERFPVYLKVMGVTILVLVIFGLGLTVFFGVQLPDSVGYALILGGTLMMLAGGARGGGYSNIGVGAVEALVTGRNRNEDDYVEDEDLRRGASMKRRDPMERLRKGLRPPANPSAFWQTIGGLALAAIGLPLTF
jgi:hypothetical protein